MKVAIFGLGYVGLTAAACLTQDGHTVLGVEVNSDKIVRLNAGEVPIKEPGVEEMLRGALSKGLFDCISDASTQLRGCDMAMVCVGTPSGADGAHNMSYIAEVSRQIASWLKPHPDARVTVVYRSTIKPGSVDELITPIFESILGAAQTQVEIVYNPEFLREAVAVNDYFNPPKIVIGTKDGQPSERLAELYKNLKAPTFNVRFREAEFTKFVDNSFHAVKTAFANEIGRVGVKLGLDPKVVHQIFVSDTKLNISPYYFRPGGAFGGSCLPKDVRALQHIGSDVGANIHLVDSLLRSNEAHKHFLFEHCTRALAPGASILMLGLAFKSDSDDLRESPNIDLARKVMQNGFKLSIYDPALDPQKLIGQNLGYAFSHFPLMESILVSRDTAEKTPYDLVIDTSGTAAKMALAATRVVNIHAL